MASPIEAQVILCDAAQADPTGKVHMLGAGWSIAPTPVPPHALAIMLRIPWDRANQQIAMHAILLTADGSPVTLGEPQQEIRHDATIEVGRPPGVAPGTMLPASLAITVPPLPLNPGRYEWSVQVAEHNFHAAFQVVNPPQIGATLTF
jgi:hypothetical protein